MRTYKKKNFPLAKIRRFDAVIGVGNAHGGKGDKSTSLASTPVDASQVGAPLIAERYANFECKLVDGSLINRYSLFVLEVVKAHVATSPRYLKTVTTAATVCSWSLGATSLIGDASSR